MSEERDTDTPTKPPAWVRVAEALLALIIVAAMLATLLPAIVSRL